MRQNRSGSSHHFSYPHPSTHHHHHNASSGIQIQTMQTPAQQFIQPNDSTKKHITTIIQSQPGFIPTSSSSSLSQSHQGGLLFTSVAPPPPPLPMSFIPPANSPPQQIPAYMALLEQQPWFHGKITRKLAETLLENRPLGSFLVRQSESGNLDDFSLSLVYVLTFIPITNIYLMMSIFSFLFSKSFSDF